MASGRMIFSFSGSEQGESLSALMFFLPLLYFMIVIITVRIYPALPCSIKFCSSEHIRERIVMGQDLKLATTRESEIVSKFLTNGPL